MKTWLIVLVVVFFIWLFMNQSQWLIEKIAQAIATAEGFYVPGSRPARNHNPGDLTIDTIGQTVGRDGVYVVYSDDATGWAALRQQVQLMFSGSHIYNPAMSILEVAANYTATDQMAWAKTVATKLGVSINTRLSELRA